MLTRNRVLERLSLNSGSLQLLIDQGIILELREDGEKLYPEEQFSGTGIDARFAVLLSAHRRLRVNGDQFWAWLNEPLDELDGLSALAELRRAETLASFDRLRFVVSSYWTIEAIVDPSLEPTDWSRSVSSNGDADGIGDYSPTRRGGQHAA